MSGFPSYPAQQGFFSWKELSALGRAHGFPDDLFSKNCPIELLVGPGVSAHVLEDILTSNIFTTSLNKTMNCYSGSYNARALRVSAQLLQEHKLTFEDVHKIRLTFFLYDDEKRHDGIPMRDTSFLERALRACERDSAAHLVYAEILKLDISQYILNLPWADFLKLAAALPYVSSPAQVTITAAPSSERHVEAAPFQNPRVEVPLINVITHDESIGHQQEADLLTSNHDDVDSMELERKLQGTFSETVSLFTRSPGSPLLGSPERGHSAPPVPFKRSPAALLQPELSPDPSCGRKLAIHTTVLGASNNNNSPIYGSLSPISLRRNAPSSAKSVSTVPCTKVTDPEWENLKEDLSKSQQLYVKHKYGRLEKTKPQYQTWLLHRTKKSTQVAECIDTEEMETEALIQDSLRIMDEPLFARLLIDEADLETTRIKQFGNSTLQSTFVPASLTSTTKGVPQTPNSAGQTIRHNTWSPQSTFGKSSRNIKAISETPNAILFANKKLALAKTQTNSKKKKKLDPTDVPHSPCTDEESVRVILRAPMLRSEAVQLNERGGRDRLMNESVWRTVPCRNWL